MASYLVTGGCGFIGSHLTRALLAAGHRVRVLDDLSTGRTDNLPEGAELLVGDAADPALAAAALEGMEGCFHLAAVASVLRSVEDWVETHRANVTATVALFAAARARRLPVVYASSSAVYGPQQDLEPVAESAPLRPASAYGADKLASELHARVAGGVHGVPTFGLRFFNVFGPRQDPLSPYTGVVSIFARHLLRGEPLTVHGDGLQTRDFIYVGDAVRFLLAGLAKASPQAPVVNVASGRATSVLDLAQGLGRLLGRAPRLYFVPPRPGDVRRSLGDPAAAEALLGLRVETALEAGLETTVKWVETV